MNRTVTLLLLALVVQLGIVAVMTWPGSRTEDSPARKQTMSPFSSAVIDEVRIGDEFDNEAVLVRSGDQWLLPDLNNLPADTIRVNALIQGITVNDGNWPIAYTAGAQQRFHVADYYYQRRLTFISGEDTLGVIYLGTSPGFRKIHARNEAQDAIYSIALNAFDTPAVSGGWLDPRLLQIRAPLRIDADLYSVHFENGEWRSGIGEPPDEQELKTLIEALRSLQVEGVADDDLQRELATAEAELIFHVESLTSRVTLELYSMDGKHFIHSSEYPLFFKLGVFDFDQLMTIDFRLISGEGRL